MDVFQQCSALITKAVGHTFSDTFSNSFSTTVLLKNHSKNHSFCHSLLGPGHRLSEGFSFSEDNHVCLTTERCHGVFMHPISLLAVSCARLVVGCITLLVIMLM